MAEPIQPTFEGMEHLTRPRRASTAKEEDDERNKVRWAKFLSTKRVHCYACIEMRMKGIDIPPKRAAWSRKQGTVEVLLCAEHAQQARDHNTREQQW